MTDSKTFLELQTQTRQRANQENSQFVTDAELKVYINDSYKELYDLIVDAVEDYNLSSTSFTITSGNTQAIPSDFYKLRGLDDLSLGSQNPRSVRKYLWNERNDFNDPPLITTPYKYSDVYYRIVGSNIQLMPPANAQKPYTLYYVPLPGTLSADGDVAYGINGWLEYVILDAAIKMMVKEESDSRPLMAQKKDILGRIERMKVSRDQGLPEKISRVRNRRGYAHDGGGYLP